MKFARHPELEGKHALLSASNYSWLRYEDDKMIDRLETQMQAQVGTRLHGFAAEAIELGIKMVDNDTTLNSYINDAIGFRMTPEVVILATYNAFGTADALSFRKERPTDKMFTLRIHDLKTGISKTKFDQLVIYAAFFCLEYGQEPNEINIELRIYQNDEIRVLDCDTPEVDLRTEVMMAIAKVRHFDDLITNYRLEALG